MILWEIKKIIRSKFFIVSLLLIIALYVFDSRFPNDVKGISVQNEFFDELLMNEEEYETYALPYYEELDKIDTMRLFGMEGVYLDTAYYDYRVIGELKKKKEYVSEQYEKVMIDTVRKSAVSMGKSDSFFEKKLYETHISTYNTWVDVVEVNEKGIEPFHIRIFHESTAGMVLILWCVALSAQAIGFEEHKNLKLMVSSVYRGRKENILSKIAAVAIIVAVVKMSMVVLNIIQGPIFYGVSFRTLFAPIQSLEEYQMCNFHISIMGFFLLAGLGQLILLELVVCITSVLSYFTKAIPAAAVSLIVWEVPVFLLDRATFDTYFEIERFNKIRQYAPWALNSSVDYFYSFDYGKFIIFPVNRFIMCITVCLVIMGVCVALCAGFADKINRGKRYGIKSNGYQQKVQE